MSLNFFLVYVIKKYSPCANRLWLLGLKSSAELLRLAWNKLLIYDKGIDPRAIPGQNMDFDQPEGSQFAYQRGDILMPKVKFAEQVRLEMEHFLDCIRNSQEPLAGLNHARTVVSTLERARRLNGEVKHGNLAA